MLGDVLKKELYKLKFSSIKKTDKNAFWIILRDIAVKEILATEDLIDSDIIIPIYYKIICEHLDFVPPYFQEILPSNKQERFRVIIRNLFSSNAFHPDGLANQPGILAHKEINSNKKGYRIIYGRL